jgi:hypothetical protein
MMTEQDVSKRIATLRGYLIRQCSYEADDPAIEAGWAKWCERNNNGILAFQTWYTQDDVRELWEIIREMRGEL